MTFSIGADRRNEDHSRTDRKNEGAAAHSLNRPLPIQYGCLLPPPRLPRGDGHPTLPLPCGEGGSRPAAPARARPPPGETPAPPPRAPGTLAEAGPGPRGPLRPLGVARPPP